MFSSLSSYIWGEETQNGQGQEFNPTLPDNVKASRDQSPDDWVLVGETASPAPGNLTGALPPLPGNSTPSQSSSASSEAGDNEAVMAEAAPEPAAVAAVTALVELLPDSGNSFRDVSDKISLVWDPDSDGCFC